MMKVITYLPMIILCVLIVIVTIGYFCGYRVNTTVSLPKGIYRTVSSIPMRGDYVLFCLDTKKKNFAQIALSREYLPAGQCAYGTAPLGKIIYGMPGDMIDFNNEGMITVNGQVLPFSKKKIVDRNGRAMPQSLLQSGRIPKGMFLPLSYCTNSFDARYFGLEYLQSVKVIRPVLVNAHNICGGDDTETRPNFD